MAKFTLRFIDSVGGETTEEGFQAEPGTGDFHRWLKKQTVAQFQARGNEYFSAEQGYEGVVSVENVVWRKSCEGVPVYMLDVVLRDEDGEFNESVTFTGIVDYSWPLV